jgi:hypothetical protein
MNSIIKLTSGETLVAEVVHEDELVTSILEPLALEFGEGESGRPMLIAMSWIPLTKAVNMVNLKTSHVIAVAECDDEVSSYYEKSLAIMKHDIRKLQEIMKKETGIDDINEIKRRLAARYQIDDEDEEFDQWVEEFGDTTMTANTVH